MDDARTTGTDAGESGTGAVETSTFLGITRTRWAVLCMAGAWMVLGLWLMSPMVEVVYQSGRRSDAAYGWKELQPHAELRETREMLRAFLASPGGAFGSSVFWGKMRDASIESLILAGPVGILILPIYYRHRKSAPKLVRVGALCFFFGATAVTLLFAVMSLSMSSGVLQGPYEAYRLVIGYGVWLPPVFFTLAFLSVLLGGEKPARDAESAAPEQPPAT